MLQTKNNKIQRGFSVSAKQYDHFAGLHRQIADKLLAQVTKEPQPSALLDVGCGTGYLTVKAKENFSQTKMIGLDFSPEMLEVAGFKDEGIAWVLGNSNDLPFSDGHFDMVISNLAYQWAEDLTKAFKEAWRVLSTDGVFACTLFGYHTCQELFQSLDEATSGALRFSRLPDHSQVCETLSLSGFKNSKVDCEQIKIEFNGMQELIAWLKSIGANNLSRQGHVGRDTISLAASIYRQKFSYLQGVGATFEVIRVYAKK